MDAETIVETAELVEQKLTWFTDPGVKLFGVGVAGFALGLGVGIKFVSKQLETKYVDIAEREIAEAKQYYSTLYKNDYPTIDEAAEAHGISVTEAAETLLSYQGRGENSADPGVVIKDGEAGGVLNIFVNNVPVNPADYDYDTEVERRTPNEPYIITEEEYLIGEEGYEQESLTFYTGDGILADPRDEAVPDSDAVVGDVNLIRFGAGSNDPNTLYVRNERVRMDFEIVRTDGTFAETVHGILRHSADKPQLVRFERGGRE